MSKSLEFEIGADLGKLDRDLSKATGSISGFADKNKAKFESIGNSLQDLGGKLSVISLAIAGFGALSVKAFADVDKGLREVNTLFGLTGEAAEKNFTELINITKEASSEVGILQSEISKGLYNAISAGVPKDNALDFIITAGKAAIGGVTDLNTAVDGITTIINAFGKDFSEAEAVSDSLFAAVQGGKTTFEELSASLFNVAPAAAAANVRMEEVNAAIATLTASGTPTRVATTQLRAALVGLQKPSEDLNALFKSLGFQNAQAAIEAKGLKFALDAVAQAADGDNGKLQTLLGSVEAVAAAQVLAGTGSQKFSDELERQRNATGAAEKAFEQLEKSLPRQLERLKVQFSNIAIEIGSKLAPIVGKLASILKDLLSIWDGFSDRTKNTILVVGGLVAAIGPLLFGIGTLVKLIPIAVLGLSKLIAGFTALKVVILANPLLALAAVITGITAAFLIYNKALSKNAAISKTLNDVRGAAAVSLAKEKSQLDTLLKVAKDETKSKEERLNAIKALNRISPEYLGNITLEEINTDKTTSAVERYIVAINKKALSQAAASKKQELFAKRIEKESENLGGTIDFVDELSDKFFGLFGVETFRPKGIEDLNNFLEENIKKGKLTVQAAEAIRESYRKSIGVREKELSVIDAQIAALDKYIDVSDATAKSIDKVTAASKNLTGSGRAQQTPANAGIQSEGISGSPNILQGNQEAVEELVDTVFEEMLRLRQLMQDFATETEELVFGTIVQSFTSIGEAIGAALGGSGDIIGNIGKAILQTMGGFLSDFGKLMIKYGVAALFFDKIKKALFSGIGTPLAAAGLIAAGVALTAVGGAISRQASGGIQSQGGASSSTPNVRSSTQFSSNATQGGSVVFRIRGRDLVGVLENNNAQLERIG